MPYNSSDGQATDTVRTRRGHQPVGGKLRRRRGDDTDSSNDDDRLRKSCTSPTRSRLRTKASRGNDEDECGEKDENNYNLGLRSFQQVDASLTRTQSQTQTQAQTQEMSQETHVPQGLAVGDADLDTLRILLSTDNHLGYAEDDNVRGNDSFAALEEVLYLAKQYRCDMVLLAGDLFHQNRPSRRTLYKTMEIFKRYCMGPGAIQVQIVGGTTDGTGAVSVSPFVRGYVNYEDANYSVDLPIFSIHGNHDDPSRDGGNSDLYAALDLLDINNLVNYFGRQENTKNIRIDPILLRKGSTNVALYGLGNMRDERLNRMWKGEALSFSRPADKHYVSGNSEGDGPTIDWFNILALHQNRDRGRGANNCIKEDMIPDWIDFVMWGHEHECDIEVTESVGGTFRISQPGSSVATSLVEGESTMKKVGVLDIRGGQFRLTTIPLTQVRSFVLDTVRLGDIPNLDPDAPKIESMVSKKLEERVRVLIHDAREKRAYLLREAEDNGNPLAKYYNDENMSELPLKQVLEKEDQVLVRLKVDHTGFAAVHNQRFGAKFVGDIANPTDILLFTRKRAEKKENKSMKDIDPIEPTELDDMEIEDLIVEQFEQSNTKLEVFDDKKISVALDNFVEKQQTKAINETIEKLLLRRQKKLIDSGAHGATHKSEGNKRKESEDDTDRGVKKKRKIQKRKIQKRKFADDDDYVDGSLDDDVSMEDTPAKSSRSRSTNKKESERSKSSKKRNNCNYEDSDDDVAVEFPSSKSKSNQKIGARGRAVNRSRKDDSDNDDSDIMVVDPPPRKRTARNRSTKNEVDYYLENSDDSDDDIVVVDSDKSESPSQRKKYSKGNAMKSKSITKSFAAKKTDRDSTDSNRCFSQSQLSFAPTKRKHQTNKRKGTVRKNRFKNDLDSEDEEFQPSRSLDDTDWGTASHCASTF